MNILENNLKFLSNLYEQYPESFNGLSIDGDYLVYNGQRTNISQFNLERLMMENSAFAASISVLSAEDIFRIIRLHVEMSTSSLELDSKGMADENKEKVETIKAENPLMKNINIVNRNVNGIKDEFFVITDSNGLIHTFRNDYNVNIFNIYEMLKYRHPGTDVTPDELIQEINRRLYEIQMEEAARFQDNTKVTEDFENKMRRVNEPYKDDRSYRVLGNQENDIAIVQDLSDGTKSKVVTFDNNEFGDLVLESHGANVSGTDTKSGDENVAFESQVSSNETEVEIGKNDKKDEIVNLISTQEFYDLLDSPVEITETQRKELDLYYAYLGDLVLYEDYLLDELRSILNAFRAYVCQLEIDENRDLTSRQTEAIEKYRDFELKKDNINDRDYQKVQDNVKKLVLNKPKDSYDNAASASIVQIIAFVIGISIILTAITLYLLS